MLGLLLATVSIWAREPSAVTIEPGVYAYAELGALLSAADRIVTVAPRVAGRGAVISLAGCPWEQFKTVAKQALGVLVVDLGNGNFRLDADPAAEATDVKLLNAYCARADALIRQVMRRAEQLSKGKNPPTVDDAAAVLSNLSSVEKPTVTALMPFDTIDKRATAMMFGIANNSTPVTNSTGPLFEYFNRGGLVRRLIPNDLIDTGDAYYWRDRRDLSEWVKVRAIATVRDNEARLSREPGDPKVLQAFLNDVARNTIITHRLHWSPLASAPAYVFSIVPFVERSGGWFDTNADFYLGSEPTVESLRDCYVNAGAESTFADLKASTQKILAAGWAKKEVKLAGKARSLGQAIADWAKATKRQVMMEVSTVRDCCDPNSIHSNTATLATLGSWIDGAKSPDRTMADPLLIARERPKVVGSGLVPSPAWSLETADDVLVIRNLYGFLDRQYSAPLDVLIPWGRGLASAGMSEPAATWDQWRSITSKVREKALSECARMMMAPAMPRLAQELPWARLFLSISGDKPETLLESLKGNSAVRIELSRYGSAASMLAQELRRVALAAPQTDLGNSADVDRALHPKFALAVSQASLLISDLAPPSLGGVHVLTLVLQVTTQFRTSPNQESATSATTMIARGQVTYLSQPAER